MFENIEWNKQLPMQHRKGIQIFSTQIATLTFAPEVTYIVTKSLDPWKNTVTYLVNFLIGGNSSGYRMYSPEEVLHYLTAQQNLVNQYVALLEKRKALHNRIQPLERKLHLNSQVIFNLAKP